MVLFESCGGFESGHGFAKLCTISSKLELVGQQLTPGIDHINKGILSCCV
jgi:hypothetical protein